MAEKSFIKDSLDQEKINSFVKSFSKTDLKIYIKNLKNIHSQKIVRVSVPSVEGLEDVKKYFIKIYPDKKIMVEVDPSLINGVRVVDYDNEYEFSLKNIWEGAIALTND